MTEHSGKSQRVDFEPMEHLQAIFDVQRGGRIVQRIVWFIAPAVRAILWFVAYIYLRARRKSP